jgi:hypothetical protein
MSDEASGSTGVNARTVVPIDTDRQPDQLLPDRLPDALLVAHRFRRLESERLNANSFTNRSGPA